MSDLTLFDLPPREPEPELVLDEARLRDSFARFRAARIKTLSYGLGYDSTDAILEFLRDPVAYGLAPDLSDLIVIHAAVGSEFRSTYAAVEQAILPRLRERRVRFVEVARRGPSLSQGYEVLSDSREPHRLHRRGRFTLLDEMEAGGTVPQAAGGNTCSLKHKAFALDGFVEDTFPGATVGTAIGYNASEDRRAVKSEKAQAGGKAPRGLVSLDYPLIRTGRTRSDVVRRVEEVTGMPWGRSYCWFCVYSLSCAAMPEHLLRLREEPAAAARAMRLEYVSMALNENGSLYPNKEPLHTQVTADGNAAALGEFEALLNDPRQDWAVYRVRRVYPARRTASCREQHPGTCVAPVCRDRAAKGAAWRSLTVEATGSRTFCAQRLRDLAAAVNRPVERDGRHRAGIDRVYLRRLPDPIRYGAAEEFLVSAPATAAQKERKNFPSVWDRVALRGLPA
ncbi:hypothetical protein [Streptacidiphilus jiangxiensis]|uniref:3'-phosphoadenosine 5'-phosphosulfate sulfotransferase (PAPS reductase)/FAD synthetase n=1 Tax=Streptacidiphilus jiangxiensis TaxID=235985 RepID=A0A1H8BMU7_STRJI|nr:hypothetical protein [Streptacidiphilus jiangxiensis]SEM83217.1 hypothetical protein SAMN05414137_1692 [Streptacidiphilus jiangxiensis]